MVTPLLHTGSPLSHCHWTEFTVQNKTTDEEETVRSSCNSWHALERRATLKATQGMFYDLRAQTQEQRTRKQVPRMGFMSGSLKSWLQIELARNSSPKEQRETVGSLGHTVLGLTRSRVVAQQTLVG